MGRLDGKVAVITGAANGIGLAAARRFAEEGARLLLVDLHEDSLAQAARDIGPDVRFMALDVSADDSAQRFTAEVLKHHGRVDIALLNAGIEGHIAPIGDYPLEAFDRVMSVNVRGVWLGLSALMPAMKANGGSIVITSSTGGLKGAPRLAPYCASKHAVIGLMKSAASEGAADRIRVNTVNPGPIDTRMIANITASMNPADAEGSRAAYIARIPLRRFGRPEEIASMMLFLASDEGSFCTGTVYAVDGGSING